MTDVCPHFLIDYARDAEGDEHREDTCDLNMDKNPWDCYCPCEGDVEKCPKRQGSLT